MVNPLAHPHKWVTDPDQHVVQRCTCGAFRYRYVPVTFKVPSAPKVDDIFTIRWRDGETYRLRITSVSSDGQIETAAHEMG